MLTMKTVFLGQECSSVVLACLARVRLEFHCRYQKIRATFPKVLGPHRKASWNGLSIHTRMFQLFHSSNRHTSGENILACMDFDIKEIIPQIFSVRLSLKVTKGSQYTTILSQSPDLELEYSVTKSSCCMLSLYDMVKPYWFRGQVFLKLRP